MPDKKRQLLLPIARVHSEDSSQSILEVIEKETPPLAKNAITTMRIYASDTPRIGQVYAVVRKRNNPDLITCFHQAVKRLGQN